MALYCHCCGEAVDSVEELEDHLLEYHDVSEITHRDDVLVEDASQLSKCDQCPVMFMNENDLQKHITSDHTGQENLKPADSEKKPSAGHKCQFCVRTFKVRSDLDSHVEFEHDSVDHLMKEKKKALCSKCPYCPKMYIAKWASRTLPRHIRAEHPGRPANPAAETIEVSDVHFFEGMHGLRRVTSKPVGTHVGRKKSDEEDMIPVHHKCQLCDKIFEERSDLDSHVELEHEGFDETLAENNISCSDEKMPLYSKCPYCPKLYVAKWASRTLIRHIRQEHPDKVPVEQVQVKNTSKLDEEDMIPVHHKCQLCPRTFKARSALDCHVVLEHEGFDEVIGEDYRSGTEGKDRFGIEKNSRSCTEENKSPLYSKCPYCSKLYVAKWASWSLRRHIRQEHPDKDVNVAVKQVKEKKFHCSFCPHTFNKKNSLSRHIRMFHVKKLEDLNAEALRADLESEKGRESLQGDETDIEHECQVCHMSFESKKDLVEHKTREHEVVDYSSKESSSVTDETKLKVRTKILSGQNFHCSYCPKIFSLQSSLYRHIRMFHGKELEHVNAEEKSIILATGVGTHYFQCLHCDLTSKYEYSIRSHMIRKHSEVTVIDAKTVTLPMIDAREGLKKAKANDPRPREERLRECNVVFNCPKCSYATTNQSNLQRHLTSRVHRDLAYEHIGEKRMADFKVKQTSSKFSPTILIDTSVPESSKQGSAEEILDQLDEQAEMDDDVTIETDEHIETDDEHIETDGHIETNEHIETDDEHIETDDKAPQLYKVADIPELCKTSNNFKVTFQCPECSEHSFLFEKLGDHYKTEHPDIPFHVTKDEVLVVKLVKKAVGPLKAMECPYCDLILSQAHVLQKHVTLNHRSCVDSIDIKLEPSDAEGQAHDDHKNDGTIVESCENYIVTAYRCQTCICVFSDIVDLVKHMTIIHQGLDQSVSKSTKKHGRKRKAEEAEITNDPQEAKKASFDSTASVSQYENQCPHCSFSCKRASALTFHISLNHASINTEPETEETVENTVQKDSAKNKRSTPVKPKQQSSKTDIWHGTGVLGVPVTNNATENKTSDRDEEPLPSKASNGRGRSSAGSVSFRCKYCKMFFPARQSVMNHAIAMHPREKKLTADEIEPFYNETNQTLKNLFRCPYCDLTSCHKMSIARHVGRKHPEVVNFERGDIQIEIGSSEEKDNINRQENSVMVDNHGKVRKYQCPYCQMTSGQKHSIHRHMRRRHSDENLHVDVKTVHVDLDLNATFIAETKTEAEVEIGSSIGEDNVSLLENSVMVENHGKLRKFQCPYCQITSERKHSIQRHMRRRHSDENQLLDVKTVYEDLYLNRTVIAETKKEAEVEIGSSIGEDNVSLPENSVMVDNHGRLKKFQCPYCKYSSGRKDIIQRHIRRLHPDEDQLVDVKTVLEGLDLYTTSMEKTKIEGFRRCQNILKKRRNKEKTDSLTVALFKEGRMKVGDVMRESFNCPVCRVIYMSDKELAKHTRIHHPGQVAVVNTLWKMVNVMDTISGNPVIKKKRRRISCGKCGTTFRTKCARQQHERRYHRTQARFTVTVGRRRAVRCAECRLGFHTRRALAIHRACHHLRSRVVSCDRCGQQCSSRQTLAVHRQRCHEGRVLVCPETGCDLSCGLKSSLTRHRQRKHQSSQSMEMTHDGSSVQTRCEVCGKTFAGADLLRDHLLDDHMEDAPPLVATREKISKLYPCNECEASFLKKSQWDKHVAEMHRKRAEMCEQCGDVFSSPYHLKQHQAKHNQHWTEVGGKVKCNLCGLQMQRKGIREHLLYKHPQLKGNEEGPKMTCEHCGKVMQKRSLRFHQALAHPEALEVCTCKICTSQSGAGPAEHECHICGLKFCQKLRLEVHHRIAHQQSGDPPSACSICGVTVQRRNMDKHFMYRHPGQLSCECDFCLSNGVMGTTVNGEGHECHVCGVKVCRKMILKAHQLSVHGPKRNRRHGDGGAFKCKFCPEGFSTNKMRSVHVHNAHMKGLDSAARQQRQPGGNVRHNVEGQGLKYLPKLNEASLSAVVREMAVNSDRHSKLPFKCSLCGRCFRKIKYLRIHIRRNHVKNEDQPFRCKICGSGFARITEFRNHSRIHSNIRPWKCKVCGKAFKQQAHLNEHVVLHDAKKAYQCFLCKRYFQQRGAMNAHVVHHDTLKPFKCKFCDDGFTTPSELSRHMQQYDLGQDKSKAPRARSFMCHVCQESFSHFPMLMNHIEEYHPERPFECQVCGQKFASYLARYTHKVKAEHFITSEMITDNEGNPNITDNRSSRDLKNAVSSIENSSIQVGDSRKTVSNLNATVLNQSKTVSNLNNQSKTVSNLTATVLNPSMLAYQTIDTRAIEQSVQEKVVDRYQLQGKPTRKKNKHQLIETSTSREKEASKVASATAALHNEEEVMKAMLDADYNLIATIGKPHTAASHQEIDAQSDSSMDAYSTSEDLSNSGSVEISQAVDLTVRLRDGEQVAGMSLDALATLIAQRVPGDSLTAYQTEDGSVIYMSMDEPEVVEDVATTVATTQDIVAAHPNPPAEMKQSYERQDFTNYHGYERQVCTNSGAYESRDFTNSDSYERQVFTNSDSHERKGFTNSNSNSYKRKVLTNSDSFKRKGFTNSDDSGAEVEHDSNAYKCSKCNYTSSCKKNVTAHIKRRHLPIAYRKFGCHLCSKRFVTKHELAQHITVHTGVRKYKCNQCAKSFKQRAHLNDHIRSHSGDKAYACSDCPAKFITMTQCKSHWQRHHSDKTFPCPECERTFRDKTSLKMHQGMVHSGVFPSTRPETVGPHQCHVCGCSFSKTETLKRHMLKHDPEAEVPKYMCEVCGDIFDSRDKLRHHVALKHTTQTSEVCEYCGAAFKLKKQLNAHIRNHHRDTDKRPGSSRDRNVYTCGGCGKMWNQKRSLAYHLGMNRACRGATITVEEASSKNKTSD